MKMRIIRVNVGCTLRRKMTVYLENTLWVPLLHNSTEMTFLKKTKISAAIDVTFAVSKRKPDKFWVVRDLNP